eukprot:2213228-Amphidinium_carterae.1
MRAIPQHIKRAVRRAHASLGHPTKATLSRMLTLAGANRLAADYAKWWNCPTCLEKSKPMRTSAASTSNRPSSFNSV